MIEIEEISIEVNSSKRKWFRVFAQSMWNRLSIGELRYGPGSKRQKYLTRLEKELKAYKKTGNVEQLFNIANYALLEMMFPEHSKQFFDAAVKSVTRLEEKEKTK